MSVTVRARWDEVQTSRLMLLFEDHQVKSSQVKSSQVKQVFTPEMMDSLCAIHKSKAEPYPGNQEVHNRQVKLV